MAQKCAYFNPILNQKDWGSTRVEGRLPKLELGFEYHFFIKINVLEDDWYNFYPHFDPFYPGAPHVLGER